MSLVLLVFLLLPMMLVVALSSSLSACTCVLYEGRAVCACVSVPQQAHQQTLWKVTQTQRERERERERENLCVVREMGVCLYW